MDVEGNMYKVIGHVTENIPVVGADVLVDVIVDISGIHVVI